jgi:hypothetical protein
MQQIHSGKEEAGFLHVMHHTSGTAARRSPCILPLCSRQARQASRRPSHRETFPVGCYERSIRIKGRAAPNNSCQCFYEILPSPLQHLYNSPMMECEVVLDRSISFGRRTTTRLPPDPTMADQQEEDFDFLALITAAAELYSQEDVLEMQGRKEKGKPLGHGAVSEVSTVYAAFTRPSAVISDQIQKENRVVVTKQSEAKLFLPNGQPNNASAIRSLISEIQILSHKDLRDHANIVKILGIQWDYFQTVSGSSIRYSSSSGPLS